MIAYRFITKSVLYQFGDEISNVPILSKSLGDWQAELCASQGIDLHNVSDKDEITETEYLIFDENCYFTESFLIQVKSVSDSSKVSLQFVLADNIFNERFVLPFEKPFKGEYHLGFRYVVDKTDEKPFEISQKIYHFDARIPEQLVKGAVYSVPQCDTFAAHIISPFHLLQINMAVNLNRTIVIQQGKFLGFFKELKGRLGTFFFYKALKRLNKIGKGSFIHPSAIVEGSVIGENVRIGAGSVVRLCHIGDDVTISDNVVVANSVLGDKTYISNSNFIELCMTYEEAFMIHGPYQFSIFGKNSASFAVINCDFRLDQENIKVPTNIGVIDSRQPLLGIAYGHGSKVGGGNIIAAGRIVPNNRFVNPPDSIILKFEP